MLWKMKKACEGEGPVGVTVAFGKRRQFFQSVRRPPAGHLLTIRPG